MFPYMVAQDQEMNKIPFEYAIKCFAAKDPFEMAENSEAIFEPKQSILRIKSIGQMFDIKYPEGKIYFSGSTYTPAWNWRWLILHYLARADNFPLMNQLISYRALENGNLNYTAILRKSIDPLVKNLLDKPIDQIKNACLMLDAVVEESTDIVAKISLFPKFPLTIKLWMSDEEFDGSATILFDMSANHYLDTEAINEATIMMAYFLISQYELNANEKLLSNS